MKSIFLLSLILGSATAQADGFCYVNREWAPKRSAAKTRYAVYHGAYLIQYFADRAAADQMARAREAQGLCLYLLGLQSDVLQKP